ncbi:MAG: hypothetical protein NXI24_02690 [bacterium]|nr:hypothetical protein [bacterium]
MTSIFRKLREAGRGFKDRLRGAGSGDSSETPAAAETTDPSRAASAPPIPPQDLERMQQLGRLRVIEPFEGWQHLEAVRKTMTSIEKGVDRALDWGRGVRDNLKERDSVRKAGAWISRQTSSASADGENESEGGLGQAARKAVAPARDFAQRSYRDAGEWLRTTGLENVQETLEYLLAHDPAAWVRKRAAKILNRPELKSVRDSEAAFAAMRELSPEEREQLVDELYPYDLPGFAPYMKAVDLTVNVGLGAVVATNLPGTGSLVHLINMIKTIFKIAHRLHMMSTIHGAAIRDPNALFVVSAKILQSLQGWEAAADHRPLDSAVLDELYAAAGDDEARALPALLGASLKKDLYISVPGVGTVGVGKISLDDARLDHYIRAFVNSHFDRRRLDASYGPERVAGRIAEFAAVYAAFRRRDYFPEMRRRLKARDEAEHRRQEEQENQKREREQQQAEKQTAAVAGKMKAAASRLFRNISRGYAAIAKDEYFEELSETLDQYAREVYNRRAARLDADGAKPAGGNDARASLQANATEARWQEGDVLIEREVDGMLAG